jgi:hypothetical protein
MHIIEKSYNIPIATGRRKSLRNPAKSLRRKRVKESSTPSQMKIELTYNGL